MIIYFGNWVYTSAEIGGFLIEEPMTSLTDIVTGIVGVVSYFRLKALDFKDIAHRWFRVYFMFIGIATLCAGILGHATQYLVGFNAKCIGWSLSSIALFCLEHAALHYYQKVYGRGQFNWMRLLFLAQLLAYFIFVLNPATRVFTLVKINSFFGMAIVCLSLFYGFYKKTKTKGAKMVVLAVLASYLPGIVFTSELSLHTYFNFHDISHLLMATCVYLLFRACRQLGREYEPQHN